MTLQEFFARKENSHPIRRGCIPAPVTHSSSYTRSDGARVQMQYKQRTGSTCLTYAKGEESYKTTISNLTLAEAQQEFKTLQIAKAQEPARHISKREWNKVVGFQLPKEKKKRER